jgi:hypothetical protein
MIPEEVRVLLEEAPEFACRYLELVEAADDDPGPAAAFGELAEFVAGLVTKAGASPAVAARCMAGVERVARESDDADELVGYAFLDSLCEDDLERISHLAGPSTRMVASRLGIAMRGARGKEASG